MSWPLPLWIRSLLILACFGLAFWHTARVGHLLHRESVSVREAGDLHSLTPKDILCFWRAAEIADRGGRWADEDRFIISVPAEGLVIDPVHRRANIEAFWDDGPLMLPGYMQEWLRNQAPKRTIGNMAWYGLWFINLNLPAIRFVDGLCQPDYRSSETVKILSAPLDPDVVIDRDGHFHFDFIVSPEPLRTVANTRSCVIGTLINDRDLYHHAVLTGQAPPLFAGNVTFFAHVRLLGINLRQDDRVLWSTDFSGR